MQVFIVALLCAGNRVLSALMSLHSKAHGHRAGELDKIWTLILNHMHSLFFSSTLTTTKKKALQVVFFVELSKQHNNVVVKTFVSTTLIEKTVLAERI